MPQPVVFDINVFISAVAGGPQAFWAWPSPPPLDGNLAANCVGVANDSQEFSLFLSEHIAANILRVLAKLEWSEDKAREYLDVLAKICRASSGAVLEPEIKVTDCKDFEDNRILELALAANAALIVSDDDDLVSMSPWRGIPIIRPAAFARRVDAMRRAQRARANPG